MADTMPPTRARGSCTPARQSVCTVGSAERQPLRYRVFTASPPGAAEGGTACVGGCRLQHASVSCLADGRHRWRRRSSPTRSVSCIGYPASVGRAVARVRWRRASAGFRHQSPVDRDDIDRLMGSRRRRPSTSTTSRMERSVGLSALFFLGSPGTSGSISRRGRLPWSRSETEASPRLPQLVDIRIRVRWVSCSGLLRRAVPPHDRFRLFGEVGLSYSEQEGETGFTLARQSLKTSSFGLRSGVGVVVFFL